ncbi:MAG: DUF1554 domain-containing protein [Labilithrix sp.]|nr:DUF1554 domain-containing protein [Labilithrix sp.]
MRGKYSFAGGALAVVLVSACADDASTEAPIPDRADSGFALGVNAFAFENFADGYADSRMTPPLVARMFGDEVCAAKTPDCQLTSAARVWMDKANAAMDGGRCEGFAVLSSLFYSGALDPTRFGAATTRDLKLESNVPLQEELAYWFATQRVADAAKTQKLGAKDALRFLGTVLRPGATEAYRIGLVRRTKSGFRGGHAVTPIRYARGDRPGLYVVHVYDNNFPDEDRTMTIDLAKGRWEYRASANPDEPSALYYGDATNDNRLYFASVKTRLGKLTFPLGKNATQTTTTFQGALTGSAHDDSGNAAGFDADGNLVETGTGSVSPGFSTLATWDGTPPVDLFLPPGDSTVDLRLGEGAREGHVLQSGPGYTLELAHLSVGGPGDTLTVRANGRQSVYANESGTALTLRSSVQADDGTSLDVEITVPPGGTKLTTDVDPNTGVIKIGADGTAGGKITIGVARGDNYGSVVVDGGDTTTITIDAKPLDAGQPLGVSRSDGAVAPKCSDGVANGNETDVDCGGSCAPCARGKLCGGSSDCVAGTGCERGVCLTADRFVFLSSATTTGAMGGLAGADAICQAAGAALGGTFKAFLSDQNTSAAARIGRGTARYVLPDGTTVIANDADGFFSPAHAAGITRSETGANLGSVEVWTGSQGNGERDGSSACANWTATPDTSSYSGLSSATGEPWLSARFSPCAESKHLYCVQEGPVPAP